MSTFRERVQTAIENREPVDSAELHRLALSADPEDAEWWQEQIALERAIAEWRTVVRRSSARAEIARRVAISFATVAAGAALVWLSTSPGVELHETEVIAAIAEAEEIAVGAEVRPERLLASRAPVVAPRPASPDRFAQASITAERLAYAFEPVGERVSTVFRFLVDSVPGAEVFSM